MLARAFKSWLGSTVTCVTALAVWVASMQVMSGRTEHLMHNMIDMSLAFGAVFAIVSAVLYVPAFIVFGGLIRGRRLAAIALGAVLAPAAYLAIAMTFRESEDPATTGSWLSYWAGHLEEIAIGLLPFVTSGAVFGLLWTMELREQPFPGPLNASSRL